MQHENKVQTLQKNQHYVSFSTQLAEDVDNHGVKNIRSDWEQRADKNGDIMLKTSLYKDEITAGIYEGGTMQKDITIAHTTVVSGRVVPDYTTDERSITVPNGDGTFTANNGNKFFTHFANGHSEWSAKAPEGRLAKALSCISCKASLTKNRGNIMEKYYHEIREAKEREIKEQRMPIGEPMSDGIRLGDIGLVIDSSSMNISNLSVDAKPQERALAEQPRYKMCKTAGQPNYDSESSQR